MDNMRNITLLEWMRKNRGGNGYIKNLLTILCNTLRCVETYKPLIVLHLKPTNIIISGDLKASIFNVNCITIEELEKTEFWSISPYTAPEVISEFGSKPLQEKTNVFPIGAMLHEGLAGEPMSRPKSNDLRRLLWRPSRENFDRCYQFLSNNVTEELASMITKILKGTLSPVPSYRFTYHELYMTLNKAIKLSDSDS